jgi:hypothetical protein
MYYFVFTWEMKETPQGAAAAMLAAKTSRDGSWEGFVVDVPGLRLRRFA